MRTGQLLDHDPACRIQGMRQVEPEPIVVELEMLRVGDLDLFALVDRMGHTGMASV